jgi:hypothetical protein
MECPKCNRPMKKGYIVTGNLGVRFCDSVPIMRVACGDVIVEKNLMGPASRSGYFCKSCRLIMY